MRSAGSRTDYGDVRLCIEGPCIFVVCHLCIHGVAYSLQGTWRPARDHPASSMSKTSLSDHCEHERLLPLQRVQCQCHQSVVQCCTMPCPDFSIGTKATVDAVHDQSVQGLIPRPPRLTRRHTRAQLTSHLPPCRYWLPAQRNRLLILSIVL
jgi:hypothetical protein